MNIARVATLLRYYEDMPLSTRIHLRGFLTQCTPHTRAVLLDLHGGELPLKGFLDELHAAGVEVPGLAPGPLPEVKA
jgi:hypothetical protein